MQRGFDSTGVMFCIIAHFHIVNLMQGSDSGKHCCPTPKSWRTTHDTRPLCAIYGAVCLTIWPSCHYMLFDKESQTAIHPPKSTFSQDVCLLLLAYHSLVQKQFFVCMYTCNNPYHWCFTSFSFKWLIHLTIARTVIFVLCCPARRCLPLPSLSCYRVYALKVLEQAFLISSTRLYLGHTMPSD